jgi:hypothetical protein
MNRIVKYLPSTGELPVAVYNTTTTIEPLEDFVESVKNGQPNAVVGIYIPDVIAYPVNQQPKDDAGFVTRQPNQVTQFSLASQYGTVGILAHNDLAGATFSNIDQKEYAIVVFGDGHLEYYVIDEFQRYQALSPTSTFSDFINLDGSNERLTANQLFNRIYAPGGRLVLQTCIDAFGDASWGRLFIIAEPVTEQVVSVAQQTSFLLEFASFGMAFR